MKHLSQILLLFLFSLFLLHSSASPFAPEQNSDEWMAYYETTNTIITAVRQGVTNEFAAPEHAYHRTHYGDTNITYATHAVSGFDGNVFVRGARATNLVGWTVIKVLPSRRVAVTGHDVLLDRGFESHPPSRGSVMTDSDGDGIPDGWETYVGSDPNDPSDAVSDWDGDGLTLSQEYDHGYWPTDPNDPDTDHDGVIDRYALAYHLKGDDGEKDSDGDGLSNYVEYLVSEVFSFTKLDPDNEKSNGYVPDYFIKTNDLYLGELFYRARYTPADEQPKHDVNPIPIVFESVYDVNAVLVNDWTLSYESNLVDYINARLDTSTPPTGDKKVRVRVVRYGIDESFAYLTGVGGPADNFDQIVVLDKTFDPAGFNGITEADFQRDGQFDIDWDTLTGTNYHTGAVVNMDGTTLGTPCTDLYNPGSGPLGAGCQVTNMSYLVVVGDGKKDFCGRYDTNSVRCLSTVVTRRFEATRSRPVADSTHRIFYTAHPTFTWSMPTEEAYAKEFGSSYTAFRLQVVEDNRPSDIVYDSGLVRAPKADAAGNFVWTAPICAGSQTPQGKVFAANKNYKWHVSMYNAKFRSDFWSSGTSGTKVYGRFTMNVNGQQEVNDNMASSVKVAVKYAGPVDVLAKCANLAEVKGKVRVQAFATADFSGEPVAETVATADLADVIKTEGNATIVGLPVGGTYYVRAYVDMNGNFRKDAWEPWGRVKDAVVLSSSDKTAQTVGLWIEDADTDQDWLPDAWEYAIAGWDLDFDAVKNDLNTDFQNESGLMKAAGAKLVVTKNLKEALDGKTLTAGFSSGLPGASLTVFESINFAQVLLGLTDTATVDAINAAVQAKVAPDSVKITGITLSERKIVLTVGADVSYEIAGMPLNLVYDLTAFQNVKLRVLKKDTLLDAEWSQVGSDITVTFVKGKEKVEVDVSGKKIDFSSGFYKVEIVE